MQIIDESRTNINIVCAIHSNQDISMFSNFWKIIIIIPLYMTSAVSSRILINNNSVYLNN